MRVRVESDGTAWGTKVYNAETGEDISNDVCRVQFDHSAGDIPTTTLTFRGKPGDGTQSVRVLGDDVDCLMRETV